MSYTDNTNAGTATASASFAGDANHNASSDSKTFTITKAATTTVVSCTAGPFTYTGAAQTPCSATVTGPGLSQALTVSYSDNTNAGTATASASYAESANYFGSSDSKNFTIGQAASATVVSCPASVTYTGAAQTPCTANVTGAGGLNASLTVSYSNNTNAGTATASASFAGDANHSGSADSKNFTINKAATTTVVTCTAGPFTYTGAAQTPCSATVTGPGLSQSLTVSYSNNTSAGTATASASYAESANYFGSSDSKNFTIAQAASATTVSCPASVTFTGSAHTPCMANVTGAGGLNASLTVNYSNNTNAGTATASASFGGDANHSGSNDSKTFTISKANQTITFGALANKSYPGPDFTVSATASSGLPVSFSSDTLATCTVAGSTVHLVAPGTCTIRAAQAGNGNYNAAADVTQSFTISTGDALAPIVSSTLALPVPIGTAAQVTATISDSTTGGSNIVSWYYTVTVGTTTTTSTPMTVTSGVTVNVTATIAASSTTGVKEVCVYGTDSAGNTNLKMDCTLLAVYDPSNGFITGGGWITSPVGAYTPDPLLTGKANFGFVSKYQNGKGVPTGDTEFQFHAAGMNFKSAVYEWLVVSGPMGQFKGSGTINGTGDYGFLLTAVDGSLNGGGGTDKFRIKIWNKTTSAIVYDNNMAAADTATPTTVIGGGSIQIKK